MAYQPYLLMNRQQAARFRDDTAGDANRLDPRDIDNGPYKGQSVLPRRVTTDPAFASHKDMFDMLQEVQIDPDVTWPQPEV